MDVQTQHFLWHWLVSGLAVLLTSKMIRGFEISGFFAAIFAALMIGLANAILWPVLFVLSLPINILTLGLFTFVINGAILKICAIFIPGFKVQTWFAAIIGALVLALVGGLLHAILI
jgi:putative membrane protein